MKIDSELHVVGRPLHVGGYLYAWHQPCLVTTLQLKVWEGSAVQMHRLRHLLQAVLQQVKARPLPEFKGSDQCVVLLHCLLHVVQEMQRVCAHLMLHPARLIAANRETGVYTVQIGVMEDAHAVVGAALQWVLDLVNQARAMQDEKIQIVGLSALMKRLGQALPHGRNTIRFLAHAHRLGIPVAHIAGPVYQFGQSARARWLNSTFTDESSQVSALLARSKPMAAQVLRKAGLPVAKHSVVSTVGDAVSVAQALGYPVVVKPADLDGGVAVAAGLQTEEGVRKAFLAVSRHTRQILVEQFIPGRDYRVYVLHGKMMGAMERVPGGVVGDGVQSIQALIEQMNREPGRGESDNSPLRCLIVNEEAIELLAQSGLGLDTVPALGQVVCMRRSANINNGGTPVVVTDRVHPDNAELALRAVQALRLDLAGVDLLLPDIAVSWRVSGGSVCEVNGQPGLLSIPFDHLYGEILQELVQGNGRVPTVMVVGGTHPQALASAMVRELAQSGLRLGWASSRRVQLGVQCLWEGKGSVFESGQMLLRHEAVDAVLLFVSKPDDLRQGLPFDRFDVLVVDDASMPAQPDMLKGLLAACAGSVRVAQDSPSADVLREMQTNRSIESVSNCHDALAWTRLLAADIQSARARHEQSLAL